MFINKSEIIREKRSQKNVQISVEPGIELGTLWSEGRDLTNWASHDTVKKWLQKLVIYVVFGNFSSPDSVRRLLVKMQKISWPWSATSLKLDGTRTNHQGNLDIFPYKPCWREETWKRKCITFLLRITNCCHWLKICIRTFQSKYYNLLQHKYGLQMSAFKDKDGMKWVLLKRAAETSLGIAKGLVIVRNVNVFINGIRCANWVSRF